MSENPVLIPGEWEHRIVHAHGARFHVVIQGEGPLVLFLHGFPTFWWLWRKFLAPVAQAGFKAAAIDMRGYGASDHPPRGYDPRTLAADVAGVIRTLGFQNAIVVGQGVGGLIAWTAATLQSSSVRAIGSIASAHPNALRNAMITSPTQTRALSYVVALQTPWLAERTLQKNHARAVGELLESWVAPDVLDSETKKIYRDAFLMGNTAHCAIEFHRWALRSVPRPDGRTFAVDMKGGVQVPVLHIHGRDDTSILLKTSLDSQEWAHGSWTSHVLEAGHLLPEQRADDVISLLVAWLKELD
ncbi:MAG: alpha/beta hydrolase [Actinomycetes bacterium]